MMAFVAAEETLGQESLVAKVTFEGQVRVLGMDLLESNRVIDSGP